MSNKSSLERDSLIVDGWLEDFDLFLIPSPGNGKFFHKTQKGSTVL